VPLPLTTLGRGGRNWDSTDVDRGDITLAGKTEVSWLVGSLDLLAESVELCGRTTAILSAEEMRSKREIAIFGSLFEKSALQDDKTKTTKAYKQ
jgi:hypothetical protein